jgi:hypothetical protein
VPGGPHKTDQKQGPIPTQGHEARLQVASHPDLFSEGEPHREYADEDEELDDRIDYAALWHRKGGQRCGPHYSRGGNGYEQGRPEGDPPDVQAQSVQAKGLPTPSLE